MGMSASQARLLSITARLNHVELETQYLSNAKIRLSDSTQKASDKYVAALNKTEYQYNYYNAAGDKITMPLTGAALTTYGELKNQYGLINSAGQILVSETDAANFQNSNTLEEFLEKYGVLGELGTGDTIQVINPEYEPAWDDYYKELEEWKAKEPDPNSEKYFTSDVDNELYKKFRAASQSCYNNALRGISSCYLHVLAHLMMADFEEGGSKGYTTTTGDYGSYSVIIGWNYIYGSAIYGANMTPDMIPVSEEVIDPTDIIYAAENEEIKQKLLDVFNDPNADEQAKINELLMNNYYFDESGNVQLKTLKQKIIDMFYVLSNYQTMGIDYNSVLLPLLATFQQDMEFAFKEFDEDLYNKDLADWEAEKPHEPTVSQYIDEETRAIKDLDKAQWYVNLWHRMNGTSDFKAGFGNSEDYIAGNGWASKSETDQNWAVLKDGDMNSEEYLKYAIENGLITLEQVQFVDPSDSESGIEQAQWTSIVFSTAQDITEQKDQIAITKAETEYNQALREIEAKDKEYDTQIKKLDTEHNALQTEYDSIKSVIEKNVERSFKIFS